MNDIVKSFSKCPNCEIYEYNEPSDPNYVLQIKYDNGWIWNIVAYKSNVKKGKKRTKIAAMLEGLKALELMFWKISAIK